MALTANRVLAPGRTHSEEQVSQIAGSMPGALWTHEQLDTCRVAEWPSQLYRIVVAIDPAVTGGEDASETGAVHVDGTARLQTVDGRMNPFLACVLDNFQTRTGCAVLLNTSFNGKGETIVETPADALRCFRATSLHALIAPPLVILRRDFSGHPLRT